METTTINRALKNAKYNDTRSKFQQLLIDRQIPYLSSTDNLEVLKVLGSGAFGKVELVRYQERLYAHKKPLCNLPNQRNNILEEAIKLAELTESHPNIQHLYFINLNSFGFLMGYCEGGSLEAHVRASATTYTCTDALSWGYQLADALSFLHSRNIMHRDVKIQNILLKENYQTIVLADYGTATHLGRSILTNQVGSAIIMAPEVWTGTKYTEKCDIYSWAIVFSQLLSKQYNPYADPSLTSFGLMIKICTEKHRPRLLHNCPSLLVALMYRAWHSDPNERPTLSFIKKVLRLIIHASPNKQLDYSEEMILEDRERWTTTFHASQKHLLTAPRVNNAKSMNIYQDCLRKTKQIFEMNENLVDLRQQLAQCKKEKESKADEYDQLLSGNEKLQKEIEKLRDKIRREKHSVS